MPSPSASRWVARILREVTEDETGIRPTFAICVSLVEKAGGRDESVGAEEQACRLFEAHRDELILSATQPPRSR